MKNFCVQFCRLILSGFLVLLGCAGYSALAQTSLNVVNFGARGDAQQVWVGTTSNSLAVVFTNSISSADIGKTIELFDVGQQQVGINANGVLATNYQGLVAHITNVVGSVAYISGDIPQVTSNAVYCIYGTDNSQAFQACVDATTGTNTSIEIPAGTFLLIPPCQYTNWVPNPDFTVYAIQGFKIYKGGLVFKGAGRDATVLMGMGAWKRQQGWWYYGWDNPTNLHYTDTCVRGQIFNVIGPVTNDYPLVFQDLAFDGGMPIAYDGHSGNMYANTIDGLGWDGTSGAGYDSGSGALPDLQIFDNCEFRHMKGEMIKGLTSDPGAAQILVTNCCFWDGNATAFNCNPAHTITSCTFSNMSQIEEFYLAHSQVYPSYFINNLATNITHNLISLNGGTLTNPPYIISNNTFYAAFNGNGIATCPAANVVIVSNTIIGDTNYNLSAIVIGQTGAQPGTPDACNTNIDIYGNYIANAYQGFQLGEGQNINDNSHSDHVWFHNNTLTGTRSLNFVEAGVWSTNVWVFSNDLSGVSANIGCGSGGYGSQYVSISTNNNYWGTIILNGEWGPTNRVTYGGGSRYRMAYPYTATVPTYLATSDASQIPRGAAIMLLNNAADWTGTNNQSAVPVFLNEAMSSSVTIPYGGVQTFYWNGSAWQTNAINSSNSATNSAPLNPPTLLRVMQ